MTHHDTPAPQLDETDDNGQLCAGAADPDTKIVGEPID